MYKHGQAYTKEYSQEKSKKWRTKNKVNMSDLYRKFDLKRRYNITAEKYNELLKEQGGVCSICQVEETSTYRSKIRRLAIDHSHSTGLVRGLLCFNCNLGIGKFKESIDNLKRAISYLEKNK